MTHRLNFTGDRLTLEAKLQLLNLDGEWSPEPNKVWRYLCRNGAGMHWSETKGTIWFDGPPILMANLSRRVADTLESEASKPLAAEKSKAPPRKQIKSALPTPPKRRQPVG